MKIIEKKYEWAGSLAKRSAVNLIVLHHADASSCNAQQIHTWHIARNWSGIGYHFFINKKGEIFRGRPENVIGAHAKGHNSNSIGICFEGALDREFMTEEQIKAGQELVSYLKKKYNISNVKRHCDLMSTNCPGKNFAFDRIMEKKENLILSFQQAANSDGFKFPKYGCDGKYGSETEAIMSKCIVKKRLIYKYKNATKLVQRLLGVEQDGKCGKITSQAIKEFQQKNGLEVDGSCGLNTWKKLLGIN